VLNPRSILVIRFSSIGDIVLTTSPLQRLRAAYPAARIDYFTLSDFAPLLEGHPAIDRVIQLDRSTSFFQLKRITRRLRSTGYDLIVDFHNTLRSKIIRPSMGSIPKVVFHKPRLRRFLLFYFHKNTFPKDFGIIRSLNQVIDPIAKETAKYQTKLVVSEVERISARESLLKRGVKGSYICLIPGAAWPQKQWLAERYGKLAREIIDTLSMDVIILGTSKDEICDHITGYCKSVINMRAVTSIRESMAIISSAALTVGSDTGLCHIAEALGIRSVMILGPTARETGAGHNLTGSATVEVKNLHCRPCSQKGNRTCTQKEQYCITRIDHQMVIKNVNEVLAT